MTRWTDDGRGMRILFSVVTSLHLLQQLNIQLLSVLDLSTCAEGGVVTGAFWDRQLVEVTQSDNVSLSCHVTGADGDDVIRVVHSAGAKTLLLADNDVIGNTFSRLSRYNISYRHGAGEAVVTIDITGIQGEDSGTFACQKFGNDDVIAYSDVFVYVAVTSVRVTSISSNGDQSAVEPGGDVYLQQHDRYGVGCVVIADGTRRPPRVTITLAGNDVTPQCNSSSDVTSDTSPSGLTHYRVMTQFSYVTDHPQSSLNGQHFVCTASQPGYDDVIVTSSLLVYYAPEVTCPADRLIAETDANVTITCTVRANPGSRITWSTFGQSDDVELYDVRDDESVTFYSKAVSDDISSVSLHISDTSERHHRNYTLRADNVIGTEHDVIELVILPAPPPQPTSPRPVTPRRPDDVIATSRHPSDVKDVDDHRQNEMTDIKRVSLTSAASASSATSSMTSSVTSPSSSSRHRTDTAPAPLPASNPRPKSSGDEMQPVFSTSTAAGARHVVCLQIYVILWTVIISCR